jgi:hypothetical protein
MDILTRDDLKSLMANQQAPCISIYMPTDRGDSRRNPIRYKTLLGRAEKAVTGLEGGPENSENVEAFFDPARQLRDKDTFWKHQSDGFALFLSKEVFRYFRLPVAFDELAVATHRFHLKPLLPFLSSDERFFVLALSQNDVRLFQCTRQQVQEIQPADMPESLQQALAHDLPEKQLQFYTSGGAGGRTDDSGAMFHGHGVGHDDHKDAILRFFQALDKGLHEVLRDEDAPLVLAGVEMLFPIFREACRYPHILSEGVTGNPDELRAEDLHQRAWEVVSRHFERDRTAAVDAYHEVAHTDQTATDLRQIVPAAYNRRVDLLFVAEGVRRWGAFDPAANTVTLHEDQSPGDEDLLDFAAVHTLMNGGTVYVMPREMVPENGLMAARFRYTV